MNNLAHKDTLIVFTYAPAGLGHLRVTNTLALGLPKNISPILLGHDDKFIAGIHKFISIHKVTRALMEWIQRGKQEELFTYFYRNFLRSSTEGFLKDFETVLKQRIDVPKEVIIIATHFGLAHIIAALKPKLQEMFEIKVTLVVQVTDDSPQLIWYVPGADLIVVPSQETKDQLQAYAHKMKLRYSEIQVLPYPVSPLLSKKLLKERYRLRKKQVFRNSFDDINMSIPISGAAVGTDYISGIINSLRAKSHRFKFLVVSKLAPFTKNFLLDLQTKHYVSTYISSHDRDVVDLYDEMYMKENISLEITKPSEQAFKALLSAEQVGGSILLFSHPIGDQEYDNIAFLRRHNYLFSQETTFNLWNMAQKGESLGENALSAMFADIGKIRGIELPYDKEQSANFIWWCLKQGILEKIMEHSAYEDKNHPETRSNGVSEFWTSVNALLN